MSRRAVWFVRLFQDKNSVVSLMSAEDLYQHPLAETKIIVTGTSDGLDLDGMIGRHMGHVAQIKDNAWEPVPGSDGTAEIAPVEWLCDCCDLGGVVRTADTHTLGYNLCHDCAAWRK